MQRTEKEPTASICFSSRSRPIRSSTGRIPINNANRFICDNIFRSLSMTRANTWQEAREGTPLVALNWLERRYEIYTSKSLGRERSKSWAKSVVSNFRRSLRVASPRTFARARVYFARPTITIAKIRDYSQSTKERCVITQMHRRRHWSVSQN